MDNLFSRIPEVICSYNPCLSEKCWEIRDQCVVDLKCRPVFIGIDRRSIPTQCQGECQSNLLRFVYFYYRGYQFIFPGKGSRFEWQMVNARLCEKATLAFFFASPTHFVFKISRPRLFLVLNLKKKSSPRDRFVNKLEAVPTHF